MYIETKRLIIRDLDFKDKENLFKIVWQKDVVRFMKDWSEDNPHPESFHNYIKLASETKGFNGCIPKQKICSDT